MRHDPSLQQAAAEALRHELDLDHRYVDVFDVAHRLGIELIRFPAPDGTLDGIYEPTGHGGYAFVNSSVPFVRQRFTLAHEIGHHRLHGDQRVIDYSIDATHDWEAQRFAEAFLIDEVGAIRLMANLDESVVVRVAHTCELFYVSPAAAAIALKRYGLIGPGPADEFINNNSMSYHKLLNAFGLPARKEPKKLTQTEFDETFRDRVLQLMRAGQIVLDRGAELLEQPAEALAPLVETPQPRELSPELIDGLESEQ
jgi:Zn-dependent peptidase ImmA (M78 family)